MPANPMAIDELEKADFETGVTKTIGTIEHRPQQTKMKRALLGVVGLACVVAAVGIDIALMSPTINHDKTKARAVEVWLDQVGA